MHREYSGWNPETRCRLENLIIRMLSKHDDLTVKDLRVLILSQKELPRNLPLTQKSIARICHSLRLRGLVDKAEETKCGFRWCLAVKCP